MTTINTNIVYEYLTNSTARVKSMRGGTRSGKTYNICIYWILKYLQTTGRTLTIARQTMPALKASVMRDFFEILEFLNLYSEDNHNKTSNEYRLNGNLIEFIGLKESRRVRGRKRDDLFINEANETDLESFRQLALRTKSEIVIDYNPSETHSFIYEQVETRADCDLFVTTYLDNPFLEKTITDEIELLKDADAEYWKVYGLGEIAGNAKVVFGHFKPITETTFPFERGEKILGLDFGYSNPSALVEVTFYDNVLYWRELLYQSKLTNSQLIEQMRFIPECYKYPIIADSAEPDRIEELRQAGFNVEPAYKIHSTTIDFVKSKPLRILDSSANILREVKKYSYKSDKDGNVLEDVIAFDNHAMDAGRYASYKHGHSNKWEHN